MRNISLIGKWEQPFHTDSQYVYIDRSVFQNVLRENGVHEDISSAYSSYASTYTNGTDSKKQTESKAAAKTDKVNLVSAAKAGTSDYPAELQKKYPKRNILTGYSNGAAGSSNYPEKINVTIAPEFLAKMESDPKLAAEHEKNLADIPAACKWGESMIHAMTGNTVMSLDFILMEMAI